MFRTFSRFLTDQTGAALVETAILLPVAVCLLAGSADFGRALFVYEAADQALRGAARYIARVPQLDTADQTTSVNAAIAKIQAADPSATVAVGIPSFAGNQVTLTATVTMKLTLLSVLGLTAPSLSLSHAEPYVGE